MTHSSKRPAFICDLDGTLAVLNGRNPYEAWDCERDGVNGPVLLVVRSLVKAANLVPVFLSGRMNKDREPTRRWLKKIGPEFLHWDLYMRTTGDYRKDAIVKEEIYREVIEPFFDVKLVLDDRQQVVDMWRRIGLTCFQVAKGDF